MEKKRNQVARNGQSNSDKKNQDVSTKQQYCRRRKEGNQQEFGNNKYRNSNNSNNSNNNFYFDKRPSARRYGNEQPNGAKTSSETTRLMEDLGEDLNSVYNHGSKKQNLNHLLNFHKYTKESDGYSGAFSKHGYQHYLNRSKRYNYNKEQYLQANCKFVVKEDAKFNYLPFKTSPDTLVEWDQVIKVLISSCEESQCPICLYPPKAAKMTKCGHIYCFSCMLHYLSLSDKPWRKCPICYENIQLKDLKSSSSKHIHQSYKVGDIINLELMKREKGSLFVNKADASAEKMINDFPNFISINEEECFIYSKLIMANKHEMLKIIEDEMNELDFQLAEDGYDCPESIFVQQAMDILNSKREELEKLNVIDEKLVDSFQLSLSELPTGGVHHEAPESVCSSSTLDLDHEDDLIDEDCELTIDDIDIVPVSSNLKQFFFYQALNGQNIFLHSVNSKMLQLMFGSLEHSPQNIHGRIVQIKNCSMNEDLRKRLKYLQHLPVSSVFEVVEIEFERGTISKDVYDIFKDDLLQRRKFRQRREREEKKREKAIDEINDRQMGKMFSSSVKINIDLGSTSQFPEYENSYDMPALASLPVAASSSSAGPSYSTMLTKQTAQKSEKLWPSLALNNQNESSNSFQVVGTKVAIPIRSEENEKSENESDSEECKAPVYKNNFSDALANALKSASLNENSLAGKSALSGKKNKKKAKKILLFSSGMNFN